MNRNQIAQIPEYIRDLVVFNGYESTSHTHPGFMRNVGLKNAMIAGLSIYDCRSLQVGYTQN